MNNIWAMTRREVGAYFLSPIAYVVGAIFLFSCGMAFALGTFRVGGEASLRPMLDAWMVFILVFVLPMLTMRLLSDEFRSGTIETLMTAPITEVEVVLGKFFGVMVFFLGLLAATLVYPIVLGQYGAVDPLLLVCHYVGVVLLGALYVSVGLFFSACTKHQVVAVILSFVFLAMMTFASESLAGLFEPGWLKVLLQHVSVQSHYRDFVRGVLDVNHVVFFVTTTALFVFLAVKRLEMRRWQ